MPRRAVVSRVAREHGLSKKQADHLIRTVLESIAIELAERGRFHIAEIGSVAVVRRSARRYFDPRTRCESVSDPHDVLKINVSKRMSEMLRDMP